MSHRIDYPWNPDFDYAAFRQQVEDFSHLLLTAHLRHREAFKAEVVVHLARLYASGTQMPPYSPFMPDDSDDGTAGADSLYSADAAERRGRVAAALHASLGDDDAYFAVDWPEQAAVSQESLAHEMAWIHDELIKGAWEWDAGRRDDAAWTWACGFEEGGWGSSALSALGCLHHISGERMSLLAGPAASVPESDDLGIGDAAKRSHWSRVTPSERIESHLARARLLVQQGRHYDAGRLLRHLARLETPRRCSPAQTAAIGLLRARLALGSADYAAAEASARRVLTTDDATPAQRAEAGLMLGRALARTGRTDECTAALNAAIEQDDDAHPAPPEVRFDLHRDLGQVLWAQGRKEEAARRFITALGVRPNDPEDAEARRLIFDLALGTIEDSPVIEPPSDFALRMVDAIVANGLWIEEWQRTNELVMSAASQQDQTFRGRVREWLETAELRDPGEWLGQPHRSTLSREDETTLLTVYAQRMKSLHPRDLTDADVRELGERFECAWGLMDTRHLVDWLHEASNIFFDASTGWRTALRLWHRVYLRADRLTGCAATAWDELTGAASALAIWCQETGELETAVHLRRLVYDADRSAGQHYAAAHSGRVLARTLHGMGGDEQALRVIGEAAEHRREAGIGSGSPDGWARTLRADILTALGDLAGAEALLREQLKADEAKHGEDSSWAGWDALRLAELVYEMGRPSEARELLSQAAMARQYEAVQYGTREWLDLSRRLRMARLEAKLGDTRPSADALFAVACEAQALLGSGNALEAEALTEAAAVACESGCCDAAVQDAAKRALRIQRRLRHPEHPKTVRAAKVVRLLEA